MKKGSSSKNIYKESNKKFYFFLLAVVILVLWFSFFASSGIKLNIPNGANNLFSSIGNIIRVNATKICGDGLINQGEKCGEPTLPNCRYGFECINFKCQRVKETTTTTTTTTSTSTTTTTLPDSCSDTDGGLIFMIKGIISGYLNGQSYNYADYCTNTSGLKEYGCSLSTPVSVDYDCYNNNKGTCSDGACVTTTTTTITAIPQFSCSDTDGAATNYPTDQKFTFGKVSGYYNWNPYSYSDFCTRSTDVEEMHCYAPYGTYLVAGNKVYSCITSTTNACLNGACVFLSDAPKPKSTCTDTDDGENRLLIKGMVYGMVDNVSYSYTDSCVSSSFVREYYCMYTLYGSYSELNYFNYSYTDYLCSYYVPNSTCINGACAVSSNITTTTTSTTTTTLYSNITT